MLGLEKVFGAFSYDIGIDLGTANVLVFVRGEGIVINEPSVVAINQKTNQILAIGEEAKRMVGRTPAHIVAHRPLVDGVVSDFEVTEQMLKYFIDKVHRSTFSLFPSPRVIIGVPVGVTEVEKKAVEDAAKNAGARQVFLIEEPMAAAIGAGLPITEPTGSMIVDIGGGTTEVAVISLGGIVVAKSLRIAGDKLNSDVIQYMKSRFNLLLGTRTAEDIKIRIGAAIETKDKLRAIARGRDLVTGLPKQITIDSGMVHEAFQKSLDIIGNEVRRTIEDTPPELVADIMQHGIILSGGGALLRGLDKLLERYTEVPVHVAEDPLVCVVRGTGVVLNNLDTLKDVLVTTAAKIKVKR
ncbi:MAG: rod shape-determining protein [Candidatus Abawacabacteria bacterium RIFCSPHIGHO2_01_FULL_46_8]|uniref:Cell shape-determining protein MreB n=1 Tax=Candidatus Abawacabacteria bacterium RIFCSPHIGHO2_01_FULL_46_8 TaxID=1817815 RepID=A0A1F4XM79_9BACT|nr:MAG: rod shape-determining protein [Candidatus Abawacabacteria bacterium RIFCSPHIGHO2_01_FULL_46_8]